MKRFLITLILLVSLTACQLWSHMNYGPYEVTYLYGGVDTVEAHYLRTWSGMLTFHNHVQGGNIVVKQINRDAVLEWRSLNPHGNEVGK